MSGLGWLIKRNTKLFFKDKGMFFTSLITPMILLVLYITFLGDVYRDSFLMNLPQGVTISDKLLDGVVAAQLFSALLAVCCVTVSFCANMLLVQDKVTQARTDICMTPVKPSVLSMGYYISTLISSLLICYIATGACMIYMGIVGWYLSFTDVILVLTDVFLLVMFGTVLSSVINFFLSSQGQISAVGTIVSSGYGFICGAYMPISQFSKGLQKIISFLPGTYGTALLKDHAMRGAFEEMSASGVPLSAVDEMRCAVDCRLKFFDNTVEPMIMYSVLIGSILLLLGIYVILNILRAKK